MCGSLKYSDELLNILVCFYYNPETAVWGNKLSLCCQAETFFKDVRLFAVV